MSRTVFIVAALLAAAAAPAAAEVDFFVGPSADVQGSIRPAGDADVLRFPVPAGSRVSIVARAVTGDLQLGLTLASESGSDVPLPSVVTGRKIRAKGAFDEGGVYALTVSGAGTGEYRLALRVAPPRVVTSVLTIAPGYPERRTFLLGALPGSTADVRVAARRGSPASPCIENRSACRGVLGQRFHFQERFGADMEFRYEVSNGADVAGDVRLFATIRPPILTPVRWDLRAATLGSPWGGETALAVPWDLERVMSVSIGSGPHAGSTIKHSNAYAPHLFGTLGLTSAPDPAPGDLGGRLRIGPTVRYVSDLARLPGYTFEYRNGEPVVPPPHWAGRAWPMEIPYDPALVPEGADPATAISALRLTRSGRVSVMSGVFAVVDPDRHVVVLSGRELDPFVRYCAVVGGQ